MDETRPAGDWIKPVLMLAGLANEKTRGCGAYRLPVYLLTFKFTCNKHTESRNDDNDDGEEEYCKKT